MYQGYNTTGREVLTALTSCGLAVGNVVVWSYPTTTNKVVMATEHNDKWDANLWVEIELGKEARKLEREIRGRIKLADDSGDFVRYAQLRNPTTLGLASNCSSGYRVGITKREYLP